MIEETPEFRMAYHGSYASVGGVGGSDESNAAQMDRGEAVQIKGRAFSHDARPPEESTKQMMHKRAGSMDGGDAFLSNALPQDDHPPPAPLIPLQSTSIGNENNTTSFISESLDHETPIILSKASHEEVPIVPDPMANGPDEALLNPSGISPDTLLAGGHESSMSVNNDAVSEEKPQFMQSPMVKEELNVNIIAEIKTPAPDVPRESSSLTASTSSSFTQTSSDSNFEWKTTFQRLLYDRAIEREMLHQAYHRIKKLDERDSDCIIISGSSGVGKTWLAKTLRGPVEIDNGYFLMGKYDPLERPEPYRAFVSMFTYFTKLILQQTEEKIKTIREKILAAVGHELGVLTGTIPALQRIVGKDIQVGNGAGNAQRRFAYVMRMFMRAICSKDNPIVLVFDDIHYADTSSLNLASLLVADKRCEGLIIVGTTLDTVSPNSNLSTALRKLEDTGSRITNITVGNLSCDMLRSIVSQTFRLSEEHCQLFVDIIIRSTAGNMLYVMEFMRWLEDEDLLKYNQGIWDWDVNEISLTIESSMVGDFLSTKLERLPKDVQDVLKVAACLGSTIEKSLINLLMEKDVEDLFIIASKKDVIIVADEYSFPTDGLQLAAYSLIPIEEREAFHLSIGRQLLKVLDKTQLEENLFTVLSQLRIGGNLLTNQTEKHAIAMVCLHAGKVAARSSAYRAAAEYLSFGISLLSKTRWLGEETDLTLALYNTAAEVELCRSNFDHLDFLIGEVLGNTRRLDEQLQAQCTMIYSLGIRDQQHKAIEMAIKILCTVDEKFPKKITPSHLLKEMKSVERLLRKKTDSSIFQLPPMLDFKKQMAMRILNIMTLDCLVADPQISPFVTLKMVTLTINYGLSEHSSSAFALYGMLCIGVKQNIDDGIRFGQLGLKLLKMYKMEEYLPRVYAAYYGCVQAWKRPLRLSLEPLFKAHTVGLLTGDLEFAALNANLYCFNKMWCGSPLPQVEEDLIHFREWMEAQGQESALTLAKPALYLIRVLTGKISDPADTSIFDEMRREAKRKGNYTVDVHATTERMIIAFLFGRHREAADLFVDYDKGAPPSFTLVQGLCFKGLVCLSLARQGIKRRKHLRAAKRVLLAMKKYARHSPQNFSDKQFILQAEIASVLGKNDLAYQKYTCAIGMAAASGLAATHGLALELTAWHLFRQADANVALAESYFDEACSKYEAWGAHAKVEHLRNEVSSLLAPMKLGLATSGQHIMSLQDASSGEHSTNFADRLSSLFPIHS